MIKRKLSVTTEGDEEGSSKESTERKEVQEGTNR